MGATGAAARSRCRSGWFAGFNKGPRSLLRLTAISVPALRFHTVRYVGVRAGASLWRPSLAPIQQGQGGRPRPRERSIVTGFTDGYRPWAELPAAFAVDVLAHPS